MISYVWWFSHCPCGPTTLLQGQLTTGFPMCVVSNADLSNLCLSEYSFMLGMPQVLLALPSCSLPLSLCSWSVSVLSLKVSQNHASLLGSPPPPSFRPLACPSQRKIIPSVLPPFLPSRSQSPRCHPGLVIHVFTHNLTKYLQGQTLFSMKGAEPQKRLLPPTHRAYVLVMEGEKKNWIISGSDPLYLR